MPPKAFGQIGDLLNLTKHKFRDVLTDIRQGPAASRFQKEHRGYIDELTDKSEFGDPRGNIIGFDKDGKPVYEGGYIDQTKLQSVIESIGGDTPSRSDLEEIGINPNRLGGFDPYESIYGQEQIGGGVYGARGGTIHPDEYNRFNELISAQNPVDDDILSMTSSRPGSGYFRQRFQTPEGTVEESQLGTGRGASTYLSIPGQGSSTVRRGFLGYPLGRRNMP